MEAQFLFSKLVSTGVSVKTATLEKILTMQNPTRKKRGGMGLGIFANVNQSGTSANINLRINNESPYSFVMNSDKQTFSIINSNRRVAKARLSRSEWTNAIISNGRSIADVIQQHTPSHLVSVIGPQRCELFDFHSECSFCQLDGKNYTKQVTTEEYIEALGIALGFKKSYDITFTSALLSPENFIMVCDQLSEIKRTYPELRIAFECQPLMPDQVLMLKKTSIDTLMIPLDCYSDSAQQKHLPGKYPLLRDYYWMTTVMAVLYFGAGNVTSNIIVGLEDISETVAAIKRMTFHGIVPELIPIRPHEKRWLGETKAEDLMQAQEHLVTWMKMTDLVSAPKIKAGCAACGGCSAGFTANAFLN